MNKHMNVRTYIRAKSSFFIMFIFMIVFMFFVYAMPMNLTLKEKVSYIVLLISNIVFALIFTWAVAKKQVDILEPFVLCSAILYLLFIIAPLTFFVQGITSLYGAYMMNGCIKGTLIFLLSYLAFVIGYYRRKNCLDLQKEAFVADIPSQKVVVFIWITWAIVLFLSLVYHLLVGRSLVYVLSLGKFGGGAGVRDVSFKFLINVSYSMIPLLLYIYCYSKNKLANLIATYLTVSVYIVQGFRFILIVFAVSILSLYYIPKRKRPGTMMLVVFFCSCILMMIILGNVRNSLRAGTGVNQGAFSLDSFGYILYSNFNIVLPYYTIVDKMPDVYPHTFGRAMILETFITAIPRAIWPGKPTEYTNVKMINLCSGVNLTGIAGMAAPGLAEYYIDFGIIGCIVVMYFMGRILANIKKLYKVNVNNVDNIVLYCSIFPLLFQFIIRCNTAGNVLQAVFLLGPVMAVKLVKKVKVR